MDFLNFVSWMPFNSLAHIYMSEELSPILILIMAWHLNGAKPLSEPIWTYCELNHKEHISIKFYLKFIRKCIGKYHLQKSNSLLAKISKKFASMFVCRFVTCQNLHFGKYVRLSVCYLPKFTILASMFVCRFVCLSVRFVKHNSWTLWHIITKLGPHMEWVSSSSM